MVVDLVVSHEEVLYRSRDTVIISVEGPRIVNWYKDWREPYLAIGFLADFAMYSPSRTAGASERARLSEHCRCVPSLPPVPGRRHLPSRRQLFRCAPLIQLFRRSGTRARVENTRFHPQIADQFGQQSGAGPLRQQPVQRFIGFYCSMKSASGSSRYFTNFSRRAISSGIPPRSAARPAASTSSNRRT